MRSDRQRLAHFDLLARCHHKLRNLHDALSWQQQLVALRPSISSLLLQARMMAEAERATNSALADQRAAKQARAAVLIRCIELCPVHASAWHELASTFLELSALPPSSPSAAHCCSRHSLLASARLAFSLVADLTNFTLSPHSHPAGDIPSLSKPLYSRLLTSAQRHIAQLSAELPVADASSGGGESECARCAAVCECWRPQLHRYACLPLASLFTAEKEAEQRRVDGSRRRRDKPRGERNEGDDGEHDEETHTSVDNFDALNL